MLSATWNSRATFATTLALATCLLAGNLMPAAAEEGVPRQVTLKGGDRVVFLGDSITQAGAGPTGYISLVKQSLAKTKLAPAVEVFGAGISGNKVPDLQKRLEKDVLDKKPTIVVIYIGINDVWHSERNQGTSKENFTAGLKEIIQRVHDSGSKVILCTPSVIGEKHDGSNNLDAMLDEYCDLSRSVAKETKVQLLDLRKAFLAHSKANNSENKESGILTSDRVHLNSAGNQFVAEQMLGALGVESPSKAGKLRHVVLFKFKADATQAQVQEVVDAFAALPGKIPEIKGFEWGTDVSVEGKAEGFTHGFVVTFADAKGREVYLPHPAHQAFVKIVGPVLDKVLVFDYWTKD